MEMNIKIANSKLHKEDLKKNIQFFRNTSGRSFRISIARGLIFRELMNEENEFQRLVPSGDGRLLVCDRILIQLN